VEDEEEEEKVEDDGTAYVPEVRKPLPSVADEEEAVAAIDGPMGVGAAKASDPLRISADSNGCEVRHHHKKATL
jgi:hypothetical protein